jgi:hypothetical protein
MAIRCLSKAFATTRHLPFTRSMSTAKDWNGLKLKIPFAQSARSIGPRALRASPSDTIHLPYEGVMLPGFGINSLTGKGTGAQIVAFQALKRLTGADATQDGQASSTALNIIDSAQRLREETSATMSANTSYGMFSGSAKADRSSISNFNSQATHIFASTSIVNAFEYCDQARLTDEAMSLAKNNPQDFISRFGDSYVQGVVRGGYYIATISVTSDSRDIQAKLAGSIKASFSSFGGGSGSFSAETQSYARFAKIDISFLQKGGEGDQHANALGADLDKLVEKINSFASIIQAHPVTFAVVASPYASLINFPSQAHNMLNRSQQKAHLEKYERDAAELISLQESLKFVQKNPHLFANSPSSEQLNIWQQQLAGRQNLLEQTAQECSDDAKNCTAIPFTLPDGFKIPDRLESAIGPEESQKLGTVWHAREGGWKGTWKRVGQSRIFEAEWLSPLSSFPVSFQRLKETALLEIHIEGNAVRITRRDSQITIGPISDAVRALNPNAVTKRSGECIYTGILGAGGQVSGNYKCPWGPENTWSATIS